MTRPLIDIYADLLKTGEEMADRLAHSKSPYEQQLSVKWETLHREYMLKREELRIKSTKAYQRRFSRRPRDTKA